MQSSLLAINADLNDAWAYYQLGGALVDQKNRQQGAIAYLKAMSLSPDTPWWFYYNIWEVLTQENQLTNFLELAINKTPTTTNQFLNLAEAWNRLNKPQEAIKCYQVISQQLSPTLKSENQLPNFAIIGTMRGGTTSLYQYLIQHPQIIPAIKKEVDFFSWHFRYGVDWYLSHFPSLPEDYLTGEASPSYFCYPQAANRLFITCPQIKLILLLRDPVKRAISHYSHAVNLGWEKRSFATVVQTEIEQINNNSLNFGENIPLTYIKQGIYIEYVQKWLTVFPREQLLILASENFYSKPDETMQKIYSFLNISGHNLDNYTNSNPGKNQEIDSSIFNQLTDFFDPYNQELESYLGQKLFTIIN